MVVISIPVKSYVKKFLVKRYGYTHQISKNSFIGLFLLELLQRKVEPPFREISKESTYDIHVPEFYFNEKGYHVDHIKLKFLSICLEKLFFEDFYQDIDKELLKPNPNAMQSIRFFLSVYDITEDELKLASLYKKYQRYCDNKITSKKVVLSA